MIAPDEGVSGNVGLSVQKPAKSWANWDKTVPLLQGACGNAPLPAGKSLALLRLESLKKPVGRSGLRRTGFISGNKRESGANQGRLGLVRLFLGQGF